MSLPPLPGMGATTKEENYDKITAWANAVAALALNALPIKGPVGTQPLDNLKVPGIWYQPTGSQATTENGYPIANATCVVTVLAPNGENGVIQKYETYAITSGSRVTMHRRWTSIAGVYSWSPWYATPTRRVDNTVGSAVYVWDHVKSREQLDATSNTGWWDITAMLGTAYNTVPSPSNYVQICRKGYDVEMRFRIEVISNPLSTVLISGFPAAFRSSLDALPFTPVTVLTGGSPSIAHVRAGARTSGDWDMQGTGSAGSVIHGWLKWSTIAAWPATAPSLTPVGSVPWQ